MMKTLKLIENDKRVAEIEKCDPNKMLHGDRYGLWLNDGYVFADDNSHIMYAKTVKELNELLDMVVVEE